YKIPFAEDAGKGAVSALLGGIVSTKLAWGAAGSFIKGIPVVGGLLGMFTSPAFSSASTYAVGKVFILHFESGGTLLDFDPDKVREGFKQEVERRMEEAPAASKPAATKTATA